MNPLTITVAQIGYLDGKTFSTLATTGECDWIWPTDRSHESELLWPPDRAETCLALDESKSNYFMEFEPAEDLNLLLAHSRLVHYRANRLVAVAGTLGEIVQRRTLEGLASGEPVAIPTAGGKDRYQNLYVDKAVTAWNTLQRLFGQLAVCSCGIAGCGATYAWMEPEQCLVLINVSATRIARIDVGPFPLCSSQGAAAGDPEAIRQ